MPGSAFQNLPPDQSSPETLGTNKCVCFHLIYQISLGFITHTYNPLALRHGLWSSRLKVTSSVSSSCLFISPLWLDALQTPKWPHKWRAKTLLQPTHKHEPLSLTWPSAASKIHSQKRISSLTLYFQFLRQVPTLPRMPHSADGGAECLFI